MKSLFISILAMFLLFGCGESKITPVVEAIPVRDELRVTRVPIELDPIEINRPFRLFSILPIPLVSDLADAITNTFLDVFIGLTGGVSVDTDDEEGVIEVGNLKSDSIVSIKVKKLRLTFEAPRRNWHQNLQFWNRLKYDLTFFQSIQLYFATEEMRSRNPDARILLAFHNASNPQWCDEDKKCLELQIPDINILDYLEGPTNIYLMPAVDVNKTPNRFTIRGVIEFEVETDLSF